MESEIRNYFKICLPTKEDLDRYLAVAAPDGTHPTGGWIYDAELGFVHTRAVHSGDGVNGTNTFYDYEKGGARKRVNFSGQPCRLHTYGDSFTHCDQVNNGETWQEALAAHLQEPVRNYGVGGYSVYQAYRRMRKVHREGAQASQIILNIYDDDHYRNLVSWRRPPHQGYGITRPHIRVNVGANSFVERDNPVAVADLYQLCDLEFAIAQFGEDPLVCLGMAMMSEGAAAVAGLEGACNRFGLEVPAKAAEEIETAIEEVFTEAALAATRHVVELVETFCAENGIGLMLVLSYGEARPRRVLEGGERFDQEFIDWLNDRPHAVVDMGQAFKTEFEQSKLDLDAFVKRYYNVHHAPLGNLFTAWSLMDTVVDWLDPKPLSHQFDRA